MKIEIDGHMVNNLKDKLMINFLVDDLKNVMEYDASHLDDVKYYKKLIKAYKRILDYYGYDDDFK